MSNIYLFIPIIYSLLFANPIKITPDLVIKNGQIYTVSDTNYIEAIAIKDGKIIGLGSNQEILATIDKHTKIIDAKHHFVMPGFIEGHGHFAYLGKSKRALNFNHIMNWDDVIQMVQEKAKTSKPGEWITGRGWHQEKWDKAPEFAVQGFPTHKLLSEISSDNPVMLKHASGHLLFANQKAMDLAGVNKEMGDPSGGTIYRDAEGNPIGIFSELAMDLIQKAYDDYKAELPQDKLVEEWHEEVFLAEKECIENGVTSFQDAGSTFTEIERYQSLDKKNNLAVRLWVMLFASYEDIEANINGKHHKYSSPFFEFNAIKSYVDGALGSYGAWLLEDYHDAHNNRGHNLISIPDLEKIAVIAKKENMQLCVHAIGDRGNREVLDVYEKVLNRTDRRWRIEHAQHLHLDDIPRFSALNVLASMQTNHCTSDAPYVEKRLGKKRSHDGAYAWRSLLNAGARINIGTDVPVEDLNPIQNFYAAVTRKIKGHDTSFYPKQCLTRKEAIYGYTLANAYAAYQENIKGSLEIGKMADIVVLSNNLIECEEAEILDTKILMTIIDGKLVYERN